MCAVAARREFNGWDHEQLAAAYGMEGAFNDLVLQLFKAGYENVITAVASSGHTGGSTFRAK